MPKISMAIAFNQELSRLLPMVSDITIIEYEGNDITCSVDLFQYMSQSGITPSAIRRIIVCGIPSNGIETNCKKLQKLYSSAEIEKTCVQWNKTDFEALNISGILVFHMAYAIECGPKIRELILDKSKRMSRGYYVCILKDTADGSFLMETRLRLPALTIGVDKETTISNDVCKNKTGYIDMCRSSLMPQDFFFQCIEESKHGCEGCDQCTRYGQTKQCPYAQRLVAGFYRTGMFVPQSDIIAHQWEVKSSRQGYLPALIQVADDLAMGYGCEQSTDIALKIYKEQAQKGNEYCMRRVVEVLDSASDCTTNEILPYVVYLAKSGDEDMTLRISKAFQDGDFGLPKDLVQQKEWIMQGAENGNPRFIKAVAEMYEQHQKWTDSYKWYKELTEYDDSHDLIEKLDEVELKMLTNGSNALEIARKGIDYLFGYYGTNVDTHLAYRCAEYASKENVPLAFGLIGYMYTKGIEVEEDRDKGVELIHKASRLHDMFSIALSVFSIRKLYADESIVRHDIENAIEKKDPIAYYIKGVCSIAGIIYEKSEKEAFENMSKAERMGYLPAKYGMSYVFRHQIGTTYNADARIRLLKEAANNGYRKAEAEYGRRLFGDSKKKESFKYLKSAIEKGIADVDVKWCIAQCYMNGYGTRIDEQVAVPIYKEVAESGNIDAQIWLCEHFFRGKKLPKDYNECAKWGEAVIAQGNKGVRFEVAFSSAEIGKMERAKELYLELAEENSGDAMNNYACLLTETDEKIKWFQKAADAGNDYGMKNLAIYYLNGDGVEKDVEKALSLLKRSAELGCQYVMSYLGWMYRYGKEVEVDGHEALMWYNMAINKGKKDCLLDLASMYLNGDVVDKDVEKAIHYYKAASESGEIEAYVKLGNIYDMANGVDRDVSKAVFWYRKAAAEGNEVAKTALKRLNANWIENGEIVDGSKNEDSVDLPF